MVVNHFYPLRFKLNRKILVWGTEDWTVSAVPGSESEVANGPWEGMKLPELVSKYPVEILGRKVAEAYGNQLPLLTKIIDAQKDLSIQVHPNDEMAQREHGKSGKSEMWYILQADEGAHLYAGFKQPISPYEYQKRVEDGSITEVLADHQVQAGDVFYLPAGRVHAICGGIRLAEVVGLNTQDVDFVSHQLKVTGKRNKQRIIPFGEETEKVLQDYIHLRDELAGGTTEALFTDETGQRIKRHQVETLVHKYLSQVTTMKKRSPHVLRHTFATAMLNNGAGLESVRKLLGHASVATTEIYTHTTFEQVRKAYEQAHPRAKKSEK